MEICFKKTNALGQLVQRNDLSDTTLLLAHRNTLTADTEYNTLTVKVVYYEVGEEEEDKSTVS